MSSNTKMDNNKIEKQAPQNKSNPDFNQNKKDLLANIKSIQNILDKKLTTTTLKVINKEISQNLKEINSLINKIINDKEKENNNIKHYESILKKNENTIRGLYGDLLHEKLLKEILEEKIILLLQIQNEYELVKEKTGVIVCDGKIICNERKDNEIMILRTENSTLKNVINEKEKEINVLKEKIEILKHDIIKLIKNKTNINININNFINSNPNKNSNINFRNVKRPHHQKSNSQLLNSDKKLKETLLQRRIDYANLINQNFVKKKKKQLSQSQVFVNKNILYYSPKTKKINSNLYVELGSDNSSTREISDKIYIGNNKTKKKKKPTIVSTINNKYRDFKINNFKQLNRIYTDNNIKCSSERAQRLTNITKKYKFDFENL